MKFKVHDDDKGGVAMGCLIILFGFFGCVGGLLFLVRILLDVLKIF